MIPIKSMAFAALAVGLSLVSSAFAADLPAAIKERGKVLIAIDVSHPPYGMLDGQAKETGSDVETAKLLAADMGVPVEIVPVSGAVRVPMLISRKVDLVIASFSITADRKKVIAFSKPYGVIPVVISASKDSGIKSLADLSGKSIAVARGTTADIELTRTLKQGNITADVVRYEDESTTNTAVVTGQQDIFAAALSTANDIADRATDKKFAIVANMASYPMAVGLRKDDTELKAWVDGWVAANLENGKLDAIYQKYFRQALPKTIPEE